MDTMKNLIILFVFIALGSTSLAAQNPSDVLMTIGDKPVTVEEFKYIYEKNSGGKVDYTAKGVKEYMDLYKVFKLKVKKAQDMRYDTIPSLKRELKGYKDQLAQSYIFDKEVTDQLVQDIYDRKKFDVRVSHIMVNKQRRPVKGIPDNSRLRIERIQEELKKGAPWKAVVHNYTEDKNTLANDGDLGYLSATLPDAFYEIENAMYNLEVGEVSDIVESDIGYHILKLTDKRPARGTMNIAHILVKVNNEMGMSSRSGKEKVDSIYKALKDGADWNEMVRKHSEDKATLATNGRLAEMSIGMFASGFEDAAFALKNDGDISEPVATRLGFHIIKRLNKPTLPSFEDYKAANKEQIKKRARYKKAETNYLSKIRTDAGFKQYDNVLKAFGETLDKGFHSYKWKADPNLNDATVAMIGKEKYNIKDFAQFCEESLRRRNALSREKDMNVVVNALFEDYIKEETVNYAIMGVEERHPDFRSLMREYEEGILLFEITKNNVWDKANKDTLGVKTFYQNNKNNYMWKPRAEYVTYSVSPEGMKKLKSIKKKSKKWDVAKMLAKYNKKKEILKATTHTVEEGMKNMPVQLKKGFFTPITETKDGWKQFSVVRKIIPASVKKLEEARGFVVADYQEQLEKEWVNQLKKAYKIVVNQDVLQQLISK